MTGIRVKRCTATDKNAEICFKKRNHNGEEKDVKGRDRRAELETIFNHFGRDEQMAKLREELLELLAEVDKYPGAEFNERDFLLEYADVTNVADGIVYANNKQCILEEYRNGKITRTKKRIRNGYYDRGERQG